MTATAPLDPPPLRFPTKVAYGIGSLPDGVLLTGLAAGTLQYYLNQVVGVAPILSGSLIAMSLLADAFIDPLIGQWSDNLHTRWGRRHPLMYVAAFTLTIAFFFLWHAPKALSGPSLFGFMLVMLVLVRLSASLYDIPSNALTPELAPDYNKRTTLQSYRWFFLVIGFATMSYILGAVFLRTDAHHQLGLLNKDGYARFGVFAAILIFITATGSALGTHSRIPHLHTPPKRAFTIASTAKEMAQTLTHPALLVLMACGLFGGVAAGFRSALDNYFYTHLWGLKPQQIALLLPMGVLGSVVAVLLAPFLSRWLGKKMTMIVFFVFSTVVSLIPMSLKLAGLMPANTSGWVLGILVIDAAVVAVLAVAGLVIISSMVADVVEDNAVRTGVRSEGLLFAANGLLPKFTAGIGAVCAGTLLSVVHFPNHALQGTVDPALMRELALLFLPIYVVMVSASIFVLLFYRIDRTTHERNLEQIREAAALADTALSAQAEAGVPPGSPSGPIIS